MNALVNQRPDPSSHSDRVNEMSATIDTLKDLRCAVEDLNRIGFNAEHISIFLGQDGYETLDPLGTQSGLGMRVVRALQLFAGEEKALRDAAASLREGNAILRVLTDGTEETKIKVEAVLKKYGAHNIHFIGRWAVEHLPEQN